MQRRCDAVTSSLKNALLALGLMVGLGAAPAEAQNVFRFAFQGDIKSLDPYSLKESFTIGMHGAVYESLITRDKNLKYAPQLAESWETPEPTRWRFHLRKGVKFHDGSPFTADDVIFSANRVRAPGSNFQTNVPSDAEFVKVDDYTVDMKLKTPNPIAIAQFSTWYIMSKAWAEKNNAVQPSPPTATSPSYAALHENGTGPFVIAEHQPGVRTVFKKFPGYWDKVESNIDEAVFTTIGNSATRVAALLSGEVDWIDPVPLQDQPRVESSGNAVVMAGPELRTIFLGMDQSRDELKDSSVKGKNPFKDKRVREAFYLAIDEDTIAKRVMRGQATPSAILIAPSLYDRSGEIKRPAYDPKKAKALLTEAGYPDGFTLTMDCPNDRYVNDEAICQAVVSMLARVGVKVNLNAQPKAKYFAKGPGAGLRHLVLPGRLDALLAGQSQHPLRDRRLPERSQVGPRRLESRQLLQPEDRRDRRQGGAGDRCQDARRLDQGGLRHHPGGLGLHPAPPAGARLGRFEEGHAGAAARQHADALLGVEAALRRDACSRS